jgi:hypothetical protein
MIWVPQIPIDHSRYPNHENQTLHKILSFTAGANGTSDTAQRPLGLRYPEDDRDRQSRAQVASLRGLRIDGPELAGRRAGAGAAEGKHRVRRALGTARGRQALLVLTAPPRTEGYEKLQLLAVLGHQHFADAGRS